MSVCQSISARLFPPAKTVETQLVGLWNPSDANDMHMDCLIKRMSIAVNYIKCIKFQWHGYHLT